MNKTISNLIAFITILVSTLCYLQIYIVMVDSSPSSKGLAEYFTFISSILFIVNGLSLASIINEITGFKKYIILSLYLLIGIIPICNSKSILDYTNYRFFNYCNDNFYFINK